MTLQGFSAYQVEAIHPMYQPCGCPVCQSDVSIVLYQIQKLQLKFFKLVFVIRYISNFRLNIYVIIHGFQYLLDPPLAAPYTTWLDFQTQH